MSDRIATPEGLIDYERSLDCVHCGLCIEHCPTYKETGRESASPRGRIYMMRALMEERAEPTPDLLADLDLCLVCRACETACPSGVRYGEMIAFTRERTRPRGRIRRWMMDQVTKPARLRLAAPLLRLYQRTPLRWMGRLLRGRLAIMERSLPPIPPGPERRPLPRLTPAVGEKKGTVAVLEGCVMPVLFGEVNRATVTLLAAAGFDVRVPETQTCCGALHEHDGDLETARRLARTNCEAFADPTIEHLVLNSAGCGAALAGYGHLLDDARASEVSAKVIDACRLLLDHGRPLELKTIDKRVTYDAPCHLHHAQGETEAPLAMLARIPGIELVPLQGAEDCCGAAGIYNLDHPEMSQAVLAPKMDALAASGAEVLVTGNPGCLLQWRQGVKQRGLEVEVIHPLTLLARCLG